MNIWIDGDACPKAIMQILFRAAIKRQVPLIIVANHLANTPPSPFIKRVLVEGGFDVADNYIMTHAKKQDLVITADILLADRVIENEAMALNPRGALYSTQNIKQVLAMRNMNESLRNNGLIQGGMNQLNPKDIMIFSNNLDKIITQFHR